MSNTTNISIKNKVRSLFKYWYLLVVLVFIGSILAPSASAGSFSQAYLRLDRTKVNTALSGTVCAKPSSAGSGAESKVLITFPSDFTISASPSNHTSSTSNLPSGSTPWPSIGSSANSVSGQTVTFSGGDLTSSSALYCFKFSSSSSTTGSVGNNKTGSVSTKNSSDSVIDSSNYAVSIVSNDQITVNASVPSNATHYSTLIEKMHPEGSTFPQGTEIEYRITYSSTLSSASNITLEARWSDGTIEGNFTPTIEVLQYITGSATPAYNSAPPFINVINKTITWQINSLPGNSPRTVFFRLRTTNNYQNINKVNFFVSSRILFPGGTNPYSNNNASYKYLALQSPSTTPTPTPTPASALSPTPTPVKAQINVEVREISNKSAKIFIQTDSETRKIIRYGKLFSGLSQNKTSDSTKDSLITLDNLNPESTYFFRVTTIDRNNNRTTSDIFTFKTAKNAPVSEIIKNTLIVTSNDSILHSPKTEEEIKSSEDGKEKEAKDTTVIIPEKTTFKFKFSIKKSENIKNVKLIVRRKKVLGIRIGFNEALVNTDSVELVEVEPGTYEGTLLTKPDEGEYEIIAQVTDLDGNITEQKIANLKIINRFTVKNKKGKPIEGARILLYVFNNNSKTYQIVPSDSIKGGNPKFSGHDGKIDLALPKAKYKASIAILGYKDQDVKFEIGEKEGQGFPIVKMDPTPISFNRIAKYYLRNFTEVFLPKTYSYFSELSKSIRIFDLVSFLSLSVLVFSTLFAFSKKHHIPISSVASYFYYLLDHKKKHDKYITGVVFDEDDGPIPSANVYITDAENEEIVGRAKTNKRGEFFWKKQSSNNYLIMIMAKGFNTSPLIPFKEREHLKFRIDLDKKHQGLNIFENAERIVSSVIGMTFEGLMVLTLIFEVLFIFNFGFVKTLPFLFLSMFNLVVWTLHLRHRHAH